MRNVLRRYMVLAFDCRLAGAVRAALAGRSTGAGTAAGLAAAGAFRSRAVRALAGVGVEIVHGNLLWSGKTSDGAKRILSTGRPAHLNETADLQKPRARALAGIGRVMLWNGGSLWIGRNAGPAQAHAHHAIQISIALTGQVKFRCPEQPWESYQAALVPPHQPHQFDGDGQSVAQIFVEPETLQGRALLQGFAVQAISRLDDLHLQDSTAELRRHYAASMPDETLVAGARNVISMLAGGEPQLLVDPRISRVIEWLRSRRDSPASLADAARVAHLSTGRFRHLFVAQTGISFRAYLLWTRVSAAVGAAMGGASWTDAAQSWGFADSAHLSRTCRRMFGIAPSSLVRER
jgi:AraC family transcriptional regulator